MMKKILEYFGMSFVIFIAVLGVFAGIYSIVFGPIHILNANLNDNKIYRYDFDPENSVSNLIDDWNANTTENKFIEWRYGLLSSAGAGGLASVTINATSPEEFFSLRKDMDSDGPVFFNTTWVRSSYYESSVSNIWSFLAWNRNGFISYEDKVLTDKCYPLYTISDSDGITTSVITIGKGCLGTKVTEQTVEWNKLGQFFPPFASGKSEEEVIEEVKELLFNGHS